MSQKVRIHNPQPWPVIYTSDGRQLDGNTSVMADLSDPVTERLIAQGRLIVPAEPVKPEPLTPPKQKASPGPKPSPSKTTVKEDTDA